MTDKFEQLKDALQSEPPLPDSQVRKATLNLAMARFAEKNAAHAQGTAREGRHTSSDGMGPSAIWSVVMTVLKATNRNWTPVLAGGASLAVLTLAVLSTHSLRPDLFDWRETAVPPKLAKQESLPMPAKPDQDAVANLETSTAQEEPLDRVTAQPAPEVGAMPPAPGNGSDRFARGIAPSMESAPVTSGQSGLFSGRSKMAAPGSGYAVPTPRLRQADLPASGYREQGRDRFEAFDPNPVKVVKEDPVSTFSIDVDTASYAFMRARLNEGVLPAPDSVRVEELVNYFPYDYAGPDSAGTPFKTNVSVMPTPWNGDTKLMRIGIKGYEPAAAQRPRSNLVFLIDTSGSMQAQNKLPLLRNAFKLLLTSLNPDDTVSIVTYAGSAGTALEPTKVSESGKILAALETLTAAGSTAGGEGIRQAYALAEANKVDGINRVILATDGDFNVGISDKETLKDFVAREREKGVSLSVLGFEQHV
ncbi:MAG: von Willebrand factor type A domain-containing protein, partial [Planctomycetes bacterium]|nr:von Willebrand factor type A domain-containing protein [Planctomycetota bacterium]